MTAELPFAFEPGDGAMVFGKLHVLVGEDADGAFRIRRAGGERLLRLPDGETGLPALPDAAALLALQATGDFEPTARRLDDLEAEGRRLTERDAREAASADPFHLLRQMFLQAYDADPCSLTKTALQNLWKRLLASDDVFRRLALRHPRATRRRGRPTGPWIPCDKTMRDWIPHRGRKGERLAGDCVSESGRVERKRRIDHPVEILSHWIAVAHAGPRRGVRSVWRRYRAELGRISRGEPTGRLDADDRPISFPKPARPHKEISYASFWRRRNATRGAAATEAGRGARAAEAEFGGGGTMERAVGVARLGKIDDSPAPILCKVEIGRSWWVGRPTVSLLHDVGGRGWWGLDLSWDAASSSTALRTIADASTPKRVPADMAATHPDLAMFCARFDRLAMDNLSAHHGRHVTDALREIGTDADLTGAGRPRDKADTESEIGKLLQLAFKSLPNAVDPIPLRRHDDNDPPIDDIPTLAAVRVTLLRAMALHNASPHGGLAERSPLSLLRQELNERKLPIIRPLSRFRRSIGMVEYEVELRSSGIEHFSCLRYAQKAGAPSLFERLRHLERPSKRTVRASVTVKIRYDAGNLGVIHVWDPIARDYVDFPCTLPRYADNLPKLVHGMIIARIAQEERATVSEAQLLEWQARLFDEQAGITQASAETERRTAAALAETPPFRRMAGRLVAVRDEDGCAEPPGLENLGHLSDHELAAETSEDAAVDPPRGGGSRPPPRRDARPGAPDRRKSAERRPAPTTAAAPATRAAEPAAAAARPPRPRSPSNRLKWNGE